MQDDVLPGEPQFTSALHRFDKLDSIVILHKLNSDSDRVYAYDLL